MRRRGVRCAGPLLLAAAVALVVSAERLAERSRRASDRRDRRIAHRLATRQQVAALFTFDDRGARDWISGAEGLYPGTVVTPARFGQGRALDGRKQTWMAWPIDWLMLGTEYTVAVWAKIVDCRRDQDILFGAMGGLRTGFRLEDGDLVCDVPGDVRQCARYPFRRYGEFVHLAASVDAAAGTLSLYEDGFLRATGVVHSLRWPSVTLAAGKATWYAARSPFHGVLDDTVLWRRSLSGPEIRRLASSRSGVVATLAPADLLLRLRLTQAWTDAMQGLASLRDLADLRFFRGLRRERNTLPVLRLVLSGKDRRHLIAGHERSRRSGRRVQAAARLREIHAAFGGRVHAARLCLHGSDTGYADAARPGYLLELEGGSRFAGSARILLQPPESCGFLEPLAVSALCRQFGAPDLTAGLCRLYLNGAFLGVYRYSDHERNGLLPGDFPGAGELPVRAVADWRAMFRERRAFGPIERLRGRSWPCGRETLDAIYGEVEATVGPLLLADPQSPLGSRALRRRFREGLDAWRSAAGECLAEGPPAERAAALLDEFFLLGTNASPTYLTSRLDLAAFRPAGVTVRWESSAPEVLSHAGAVLRPESGGPVGVVLQAVLDDGTQTCTKELHFRVMPQSPAMPAVFLSLGETLAKDRRMDAVVEIVSQGLAGGTRRLTATQSARGGVNHRGNSSYWGAKKLFSIKTDQPHGLFGDGRRRMLKTINGRQDPTFVLNGLAYGLFRAFEGPGEPRFAPQVRPAEIFVNSRYHGLYELCTRIDETLLGEPERRGKRPPPVLVFRHETVPPRDRLMRISRPAQPERDWMQPFLVLEEGMSRPDWRKLLDARMDLGSLVDFHLLLNLMQNWNGAPHRFLAHDVLVYVRRDQRFVQMPWDFDRGLGPKWHWIANNMLRQLQEGDPGYWPTLARRWFELRGSVLTETAVLSRIDSLAQPIADAVIWEYERWNYKGSTSYEKRIAELKAAVLRNLDAMDAALAAWHAPGEPAASGSGNGTP